MMAPRQCLPSGPVTAVLGPTNTGKTHLAVERMCGHVSGMIGFPLRLLAREVYDKVVALKGVAAVALITGEEKIVPEGVAGRSGRAEAKGRPRVTIPTLAGLDSKGEAQQRRSPADRIPLS